MGLRAKIIVPLVAALLLLAATVVFAPGRPALSILLGLSALLLALAAWSAEIFVIRPLTLLGQVAGELTANARITGNPGPSGNPSTTDLPGLATHLLAVRDRVQDIDARLIHEIGARQKLEQALREIEERYVLAVERANDGMWEWDLRTNAVQFSPRWKGMLGYLETGIGRLDEWKKLVHPMDRDGVMLRLDNHLEGLTPYFNAEYRVLHNDGRYRWLHSRGTAIRHASGKPYRIVVMDNDVHARKEMEDTLIQAAEGLSSVTGADFYRNLMQSLSAILDTRDNLVCRVVGDPPVKARTLAYLSRGKFEDNFEYDLEGTSCGAVIGRRETVYVPHGVCDIWPLEKRYDRDSYLGVPLFDSAGRIIGHFACMDDKPMRQDLPHLAIFKIFAVRAAAEMERMLLKERLGLAEGT